MGTPQYYDTNNPLKLGGIIYTFYQQDNDSVLYKTCRMKELEEIGTFRPDSLTAKYFNINVKESIKAEFNYLIIFNGKYLIWLHPEAHGNEFFSMLN